MDTKTDILDELRSLSPLVAGIEKINVFTVPEGYFETISTTVLACLQETDSTLYFSTNKSIQAVPAGYFDQLAGSVLNKIKAGDNAGEELKNASPLLQSLRYKNVFDAPAGYFDQLAGSVINKINTEKNASEEISGLSPLLFSLRDKNVLEVPIGYFDQLASSVIDKTNTEKTVAEEISGLSPLLFSLRDKNVLEVPAGYFAQLEQSITKKIVAVEPNEELQDISPLLQSIQGNNVYEVPEEYFTGLADAILNKVKPTPAKLVKMPARRTWMKYAVAAMLTGVMATGIYKAIEKPGGGPKIPTNSVTVASLDASIEKGKSMNDQQFNDALANLNEADIAKYLESNGDVADVGVLNSNLEDVNLPSQDDYLTDEKTLDKYLKELEKTTVNN